LQGNMRWKKSRKDLCSREGKDLDFRRVFHEGKKEGRITGKRAGKLKTCLTPIGKKIKEFNHSRSRSPEESVKIRRSSASQA